MCEVVYIPFIIKFHNEYMNHFFKDPPPLPRVFGIILTIDFNIFPTAMYTYC